MRPLSLKPGDRPTLDLAAGAPCRPDPEAPKFEALREPRLDLQRPLKLDNLRAVSDTEALTRMVQATDEALARYEARQAMLGDAQTDARGRAKGARKLLAPVLDPGQSPRPRRRLSRLMRRAVWGLAIVAVIVGAGGLVQAQRMGLIDQWAGRAQRQWMSAATDTGLTVQAIEVVGRHSTPRERLLDAIGVDRGMPILAVDLNAVRERLLQIGWVKEVRVERILPGTLRIEIVERAPFARWQERGEIHLIDAAGTVLEGQDFDGFTGLRRVVGAGAGPKAAELFHILAAQPDLFKRVTDMVNVRDRRWDVVFDNGVIAKLPEDGMETAWARLADLQRVARVLDKDIVSIDMRSPDRLFVRLTPEAAAARQPPDPKRAKKS